MPPPGVCIFIPPDAGSTLEGHVPMGPVTVTGVPLGALQRTWTRLIGLPATWQALIGLLPMHPDCLQAQATGFPFHWVPFEVESSPFAFVPMVPPVASTVPLAQTMPLARSTESVHDVWFG
jgi:hypothetical protein